MRKKLKTIQFSDRKEFDKEVNYLLEFDEEILDGSYEVVKEDTGNVYFKVVMIIFPDRFLVNEDGGPEDFTGKKRIHTIQSSDKKEFDKEVKFFLELGCEILQGSYEVVKEDDDNVYSQVVIINIHEFGVGYHDNGEIQHLGPVTWSETDPYRKPYPIQYGLWTTWDENGHKVEQGTYWEMGGYSGKDGLWTTWYENGQKSSEKNYRDNEKDGLSPYWYENGQKWKERTYGNGELITEKHWGSDGKVSLVKYIWFNGERESWYPGGELKSKEYYSNGRKVGKWTYYNEDGTVKEVKEY